MNVKENVIKLMVVLGSLIIQNIIKVNYLIMKHLKNNSVSYISHWKRAMSMSVALFIHAWLPDVLETYASDKMDEGK